MSELLPPRIVQVQPAVARTDPKDVRSILVERRNGVAAQAVGIVRIVTVVNKVPSLAIVQVQPARCAYPEVARSIFDNERDGTLAQAARVRRIVPVTSENPSLRVKPVDPPIKVPDPEKARPIFIDLEDPIRSIYALDIIRVVLVASDDAPRLPIQLFKP